MKGFFTQENLTAALVLVILLIGCIVLLVIAIQPTMNKVEWEEEIYIVKSGDTLWEIADLYCPDIVDKREWVEEVKELNGLYNSTVHPGQKLTVLAPKP